MPSPTSPRPLRRSAIALACAGLLLGACGGGGGGAAASPPPDSGGPALPSVDTSTVAAADPGSPLPAGWQNGVFMEIFVRSYKDSDGDGIGDLRGLTQQLDYLRDLGVTGLWLMPVTASQDHDHGYAVADYRNIEAQYGTLADLDTLLQQAHARGIGVVIDYVMNHSAAQHPAFVNAKAASSNSFRNWYLWQGLKPSGWNIYGGDPWRGTTGNYYFAPFWDQMPDWNLTNPAVVAWHQDNLRFWLNRGVDGFRFDAVGNLVENGPTAWENQPQNYTLLGNVRQMMNGYSRRFLVCEGPSDPFGYTAACGSAFAFNNYTAGVNNIIAAAKGDTSAVQKVGTFPTSAPAGMSTMLANHDSFAGDRVWSQLQGNDAARSTQNKLAAATYLLQPGTPFLYYGEEVGMARGNQGGDPGLRTPMSWTGSTANAGFTTGAPYRGLSTNVATNNVAAQQADPASLLNFYKAMLALRKTRPSIAAGSYSSVVNGALLSFQRSGGGETTLVAINYGSTAVPLPAAAAASGATLTPLHPAGGASVVFDGGNVSVPAQSVRVYDLR